MANFLKKDRTREKASIVAARNRRELIAAGFNRRDLLKMGLLTSAGMLIPKIGLSARPLTSAGFVDDTPQSRPTTPFVEEMPRLVIKQPVTTLTGPPPQIAPNTAGGESRTVAHQAYTQFPPQKFYEIHQKAFLAKSSPDFVEPPQPCGGSMESFLDHSSLRGTANRSSSANSMSCRLRMAASE